MKSTQKKKERYTASVITRVTPGLKTRLEEEARLAGVKASSYTRKLLESSSGGPTPIAPPPEQVRAHGFMQIRAELRRQGGLMKMLIVEHGAPRESLNPVIKEFIRLIDGIDVELKRHE